MLRKNGEYWSRTLPVQEGDDFVWFEGGPDENSLEDTFSRYIVCEENGKLKLCQRFFKKKDFQENVDRSAASQRGEYGEHKNLKAFTVKWTENLDIPLQILSW